MVNGVADTVQGELTASGYIAYVDGVTHVTSSYLASLTNDQRDGYLAEIEISFSGLLSGEKDYLSNAADGHSSQFDIEGNAAQYYAQQAWAYDDAARANAHIAQNLTAVAQNIFAQNSGNTALATHLFAQYLVNNGLGDLVSGYHADGIYNGHYIGGSSGMDGSTIVVTAARYVPALNNFFGDHSAFDFGAFHGSGGGSHGGYVPPPTTPHPSPTGDVQVTDFELLLAKDADGKDIPVDPKDMANFATTLAYLSQSPTAEAMLKTAVANGVKIYLNHDGLTKYKPEPYPGILYFDPLLGSIEYVPGTSYYNTISPAQAFMHEIGHSIGYTTPVPTYDGFTDTEERRVILGTDVRISQELGAPIRGIHETGPFRAESPTDFRRALDQYRAENPAAPQPPSAPPPPSPPSRPNGRPDGNPYK